MKATCLLTGVFLAGAIAGAGSVQGAVFTANLAPTVEVGPDGEYLSAAFDLGIEFTAIQSVLLEFVMPTGYEGTSMRMGNSGYSQTLQLKLHGTGTLPDGLIGPYEAISTNLPTVPANEPTQVLFFNLIRYVMTGDPGPTPSPLRWPSYLFEGKGQISLYELNSSWSHSSPTGATVNSWSLPPVVEDMRLFITGTIVPEPSSVLFAALALAAGALRRKW